MNRIARSRIAFVFLLLLAGASPASATKYAGEFLKSQLGARAIGMGGAFVAVADDATAPYWNPAGMVYLPYREVLPQHSEKFGSLVNQDYLGAVFPLGGPTGRKSAVGLGLIRVAGGRVEVEPESVLRPVREQFCSLRRTVVAGRVSVECGDDLWSAASVWPVEAVTLGADRVTPELALEAVCFHLPG